MPTQAIIAITPGSGQFLDAVSLVVGSNTVVRETMVIADPTSATQLAGVTVGGALMVDASATIQPISGTITAVQSTAADFNATVVFPSAQHVIVDSGGGGGTQYTDETAETAGAFTGTVALGYNGTDVVGLRLDASNNLYVNLNTAIPAGSNLIGQTEISDGTNVLFTSAHPGYIQGTVSIGSGPFSVNLTEVGGSSFALGQQLAAASLPVVLTALQITALTPPTASAIGIAVGDAFSFDGSGYLNVDIKAGGGGGTQYTDETAETAGAFTVTAAGLYNGTDVVGLRGDAANNLYVNIHTALPAGSNLVGQIEVSDGTNILFTSSHPGYIQGTVTSEVVGHAGVTLDAVLGATKPANVLQVGGNDGTNAYAIPLASGGGSVVVSGSTSITGVVEVGPTGSANTLANPFFNVLADNSGHALTVNSTATASKYALDHNILSILGTAPTTAGFLDIKGADGNVFVRQTTGSNLHTVTDTGSTTAITGVVEVAPTGSANTLSNPFFNVLADNAGHALTVNSTATASKYGLDHNILSILGTAPTTAGFLDIKGADGNVFVRQTAAANLNATVVGTGTFTVQEATLDAALIAQEATTSGIKGLTVFGAVTTNAPSYTTAKSDALSLDTSGLLRVSLKDTPANTNSFLVTASIAASQTIAVTNIGTFAVQDSADMSGTTPGTAPSKTLITGGIYNSSPPGPTTGQTLPFQLDSAGRLIVNVGAGSSGNSAASATGSAVPADADYTGINIAGNLVGQTGLALGATTRAAEVAIVDGSGNQITSFGGGTQYADNAASGATPTGTMAMGWDSANSKVRALKVDASQNLDVNVNAGAVNLTDGTHSMTAALSALGTAATGTEVLNVNAYVVGSTLTDPAEATLGGAAPTDSMWVTPSPTSVSAGALTPVAISSTAQKVLKAAAGNLYGVNLINLADTTATTALTVQYVHFFNTTTTTGLSTGSWLFALPLPGSLQNVVGTGAGAPLSIPPGALALANFSVGITIVVNATSASSTTAAGTAPVGVIWVQ